MNERIKAGSDIHAGDGGYGIGTKENYDAFVKVRNKSLAAARIRRLAEQAGMTDDKYGMFFAKDKHDEDGVDLEKFAELIVRECIKSIQSDMDRETMNGTISLAKHAGMVSAKTVIKKHFGVEE